MPAYFVTLDRSSGGRTLINDTDAMVVFADSAAQAKEVAHAAVTGDGHAWLSSTTTATEITASTNWAGWKFEVVVQSGLGAEGDQRGHVAVIGNGTTLDTIDEIGAALVVALNALDGIAGAAYTGATNTLTIADATDALGDQTVQVLISPPGSDASVSSLVGTITHEGDAADTLAVVLPADNAVVPAVAALVRQAG